MQQAVRVQKLQSPAGVEQIPDYPNQRRLAGLFLACNRVFAWM
jgi:hypothetical protein